ncbi:MAG: hypothetical protein R3286_08045 [Gammaproteobacteria bacterium]|nr:hypothetical protein [Gammaproteobacteria bacterium]
MRTSPLAAATLCLVLALPAPAGARVSSHLPSPAPRLLAQAGQGMSAAEAAALVGARTGGRVLDVRAEQRGDGVVYRVKVLLDGGRVRILHVDAQSGRVSE